MKVRIDEAQHEYHEDKQCASHCPESSTIYADMTMMNLPRALEWASSTVRVWAKKMEPMWE